MKKRFCFALMSVLFAIVLLFSITACNDDNTPDIPTIAYGTIENGIARAAGMDFKVDGKLPDGATFAVEIVDKGEKLQNAVSAVQTYVKNPNATLFVYDISVEKDGVKIQPDGYVTITLDAPNPSVSDYTIFHIKEGEVEKVCVTADDGKLVFRTTGFSTFVIAQEHSENLQCDHLGSDEMGSDESGHWYVCYGCGESFGKENHNYEGAEWINGQNGHFKNCVLCHNAVSSEEPHYGGTATCVEQAKCEGCGASYGKLSTTHNYEGAEWIDGQNGHFKNCVLCHNAASAEEPHGYGKWRPSTTNELYHERECEDCGHLDNEEHAWDDGVITTEPTYDVLGVKTYTCAVCGATKTESVAQVCKHTFEEDWSYNETHHWHDATCGCDVQDAYAEHVFNEETITDATCTTVGSKRFICECGFSRIEEIPQTPHTFIDGVCSCGAIKPIYSRIDADGNDSADGGYVLFGSYPQTHVTDSAVTDSLNSMTGELPTSGNSWGWTSYNYYISESVSRYMWYIDVTLNGFKYRGVYFTKYRPDLTYAYKGTYDFSCQDDNGYMIGNVYWFKYEPVKWRILTEDFIDANGVSTGGALILCDLIIDSQDFYPYRDTDDESVYGNNYEYSAIRSWLNDSFYNTTFNELEKELILTVMIDNGVASTGFETNDCVCANTSDKVFLPSYVEITTYPAMDTSAERCLKATDYAKSQGCEVADMPDFPTYDGNSGWRIRSPHYSQNAGNSVRTVGTGGGIDTGNLVTFTTYGIVPAVVINLR